MSLLPSLQELCSYVNRAIAFCMLPDSELGVRTTSLRCTVTYKHYLRADYDIFRDVIWVY